jgi:hypothetical protein
MGGAVHYFLLFWVNQYWGKRKVSDYIGSSVYSLFLAVAQCYRSFKWMFIHCSVVLTRKERTQEKRREEKEKVEKKGESDEKRKTGMILQRSTIDYEAP